jgi:hypothetical protein
MRMIVPRRRRDRLDRHRARFVAPHLFAQRILADMPGDADGEQHACGGAESEQPASPSWLVAVQRARGLTEHGAVEPARRVHARKAAIERAELAAAFVEQTVQIVFAIAGQAHVSNLARMRASA